MKKKILALTLSVAMLTTGALTSVPAAAFEDTSICATEVSSDAIEDFDSLDTREDTEVEFDNTDSNFSSEENIDYSYEGIDSSDSEFISDETEVFTEDVGIDDDINPENSSVSETPSREPLKPAVTESIVTGLEKPLKFYPGKFYDFTVTGAGMDNTDPIENDERWEPLYWSTKNNPSTIQVNTRWRIGSSKGIMESNTYSMKEQLETLKQQVYILTNTTVANKENQYEDTERHAEELGISIQIQGSYPDTPAYRCLTDRAIRECVTNCARHAHGNTVFVIMKRKRNEYQIQITNDGELPSKDAKEGGGLSALRKAVEAEGGSMNTFFEPAFYLLLNLPLFDEEY